jgi:hypothetical protein
LNDGIVSLDSNLFFGADAGERLINETVSNCRIFAQVASKPEITLLELLANPAKQNSRCNS